jgi:hypothetical protein
MTPLVRSIIAGDLAAMEALAQAGDDVDEDVGQLGCTAAHFAAREGKPEALARLAALGADLGKVSFDAFMASQRAYTPAYWAACNGHLS